MDHERFKRYILPMRFINSLIMLFVVFILIFSQSSFAQEKKSWRNADTSSVGLAPSPIDEPRAVVQIYYAKAYSWRGYFGIHPWISVKEKDAKSFTSYQVMGFGVERGINVIRSHHDLPDRKWFGNTPSLLFDLRGERAEKMIPHIEKAVASYPYPQFYRIYPGPNSNTFISHVMRNTPGLSIELPPHAIGKDWIGQAQPFGTTESGTGVQVSLFGLLGFTVGLAEGIEVNIFGLTFGLDILRPALKLPFIGRVGFEDKPVFGSPESEKNDEAVSQTLPLAWCADGQLRD